MAPNTPIVNAGLKYVNGLKVIWNSLDSLTVNRGACRNSSNVSDIVLPDGVTVDRTVSGAGGVDVDAILPLKMYAVYVVADSLGYKAADALISLNGDSAPVLPQGYDMYRRIGWVSTNASSELVRWVQHGVGQERHYAFVDSVRVVSALASVPYIEVLLDKGIAPNLNVPAVPIRASRVILNTDLGAASIFSACPFDATINGTALPAVGVYVVSNPTASVGFLSTGEVAVGYNVQSALCVKGNAVSVDVRGFFDELE